LSPGFWDDNDHAQKVMRRIATLNTQLEPWLALQRRAQDAIELGQLSQLDDENDPALRADMQAEAEAIDAEYEKMEFQVALSGELDGNNAILSIHAGAGGTESQDWADMLFRMYLRWADHNGYKADIIEMMEGEQAGIKSATIEISGPYAYGYLKGEKGTHRLVRISPYDANSRRHTSFAGVEVMPELSDDIDVEIDEKDIETDVFRASGAGGQHMQKNSTAVRLVHKPSGLVVVCQNERSQAQNRETALKVLKARLYDLERQKQEEERAKIAGTYKTAEWGNQIRSYVLHPYQMVKDHRTEAETSQTQSVLDGDIGLFINAYLKSKLGEMQN
jgi:peptide chain release factor 2